MRRVHAFLVIKALPGFLARFRSEEVSLSTDFLSLLTSELDLEAGCPRRIIVRNAEVPTCEEGIHLKSEPLQRRSSRVPNVERLHGSVFVKVRIVARHLLLRVNVLQELCSLPPLLVCLNHDGIRLDLLDQLLRSLREHSRRVHRTNEVDFLALEALCQLHKR